MPLSPEAALAAIEREIAARSLLDFATLLQPGTYRQPPHVRLLIEHLEALERRDINRLIVEVPPRSSKTTHTSRLFPAWWVGRNPADGVILASYSDMLATDNGRAVRDYVGHPRYPFPVRIRGDVKAAGRFQTSGGGGLIAVGIGTGLTGWPFPGRLAVVDDPVKGREEADSPIVRDHTWLWWQETLLTRLASDGVVCLTGTRWHEDDLIGRVLNSAGAADWTRLRIPYLAEIGDPLGRVEGQPLEVFGAVPSIEKGEISERGWSALYQQNPRVEEGGIFQRSYMRRWASLPPDRVDEFGRKYDGPWTVVQWVDSAWDEGVGHDYSTISTWATDGADYFVLDAWRGRVEYPDLKTAIRERYTGQRWRPRAIFVEDAASGRPVVQELRRTGLPVVPRKPTGSKTARADAIVSWFQSGHVYLPPDASWVEPWIDEHVAFPNGANDDQVDGTSGALRELVAINRSVEQGEQMERDNAVAARQMRATAPTLPLSQTIWRNDDQPRRTTLGGLRG